MKKLNIIYGTTMRPAWTLIELIFIMVIIGLLAAIAIGKLSVTRDDAKLSATVANMNICIKDISNHYTATNQDYTQLNHPEVCDVNNTACFDIVYGHHGELNVTTNNTREFYCEDIENVGGHLAKDYKFGGGSVKR